MMNQDAAILAHLDVITTRLDNMDRRLGELTNSVNELRLSAQAT
jgi:hypothetical protein